MREALLAKPALRCLSCKQKQKRCLITAIFVDKTLHCRFWRFYARFQLHRPIVERSWLCFVVMFCILTVLVLGLLAACVWLHLIKKQHNRMRWEW